MSAAKAAGTPPELVGVWRGTLGKQQVVACWDEYGGSYYSLKNTQRIALSAEDQKAGHWLESSGSETTFSWQLGALIREKISGTRMSTPDGPKLPIRLTRVQVKKGKEDSAQCDFNSAMSDAFNAPRVNAVRVQLGEPIEFMEKHYRVISALGGNVASIELIGEEESVAKANSLLRKALASDIQGYLTCEVFDPPQQGDYRTKVRLRFWNEEWLSWSGHIEGYCGGAHPFFGFATTTIDVRTGKEVNLWDWFKPIRKQDDKPEQICEFWKNRCLPASLARRVIRARPAYEDKDCKGFDFHGNVSGGYSIGLNEKGIAFVPEIVEPARGMRTCYGNYTILFKDLAPYLSKAGSVAVGGILGLSSSGTQ